MVLTGITMRIPFLFPNEKKGFFDSFINSSLILECICRSPVLPSADLYKSAPEVPMSHSSVPLAALGSCLFSLSPGPFMGFQLPYLYFFSCINILLDWKVVL